MQEKENYIEESLKYFNGNNLANQVWISKYSNNEITPEDMHKRMAKEFARIESYYPNSLKYDKILNYLTQFKQIIPQGSVMSLLGNKSTVGSLSNCIILDSPYDSYGGIMWTDQQLVQLSKRRCGVGINISTLRPENIPVNNAAKTTTGAISFMHRFSNSIREVAQRGRRGALMICIDLNHPDIYEFVKIKQDLTKVTGANISILIPDEFMVAVENNLDYILRYPIDLNIDSVGDIELDKLTEHNKGYVRKINAKNLWDTIITAAHSMAEPGIMFSSRHHYYSPSSLYPQFKNIGTNPCSEIMTSADDSCRLIALNIFSCVENPYTKNSIFNYRKWYQIVYDAMRLMDDLVELEFEHIYKIIKKIKSDPEPDEIKLTELRTWEKLLKTGKRTRRTGLGITALGDALAALNIKYDSKNALICAEDIFKIKLEAELDCMIDLAKERGTFNEFDANLEDYYSNDESTFFYMLKTKFPKQWKLMQKHGRRNLSWSTVAPTGSLSILAQLNSGYFGTTSGIEPMFNTEANVCWYIRKRKVSDNESYDTIDALGDKWKYFKVFHEGFRLWANINYPNIDLDLLSTEELTKLVKKSPYSGSGSSEINWKSRIKLQSIVQTYTSHSISSTINLESTTPKETVSNIYFEAWKQGLKGITVYVDLSRDGVLVSDTQKTNKFGYLDATKRPKELDADLHTLTVKGILYGVIIGIMDNNPYEIFVMINPPTNDKLVKGKLIKKNKGHYNFISNDIVIEKVELSSEHLEEQTLTRLLSALLRHGVNPIYICEQIDKCNLPVVSTGKALTRVLKKYIDNNNFKVKCKNIECGSENIKFENGCNICQDCGSGSCG